MMCMFSEYCSSMFEKIFRLLFFPVNNRRTMNKMQSELLLSRMKIRTGSCSLNIHMRFWISDVTLHGFYKMHEMYEFLKLHEWDPAPLNSRYNKKHKEKSDLDFFRVFFHSRKLLFVVLCFLLHFGTWKWVKDLLEKFNKTLAKERPTLHFCLSFTLHFQHSCKTISGVQNIRNSVNKVRCLLLPLFCSRPHPKCHIFAFLRRLKNSQKKKLKIIMSAVFQQICMCGYRFFSALLFPFAWCECVCFCMFCSFFI